MLSATMPRRFATTDIHGCSRTLRHLVEQVLRLTPADELYVLGDYVNKGPDTRGVLDYLMQLEAAGYQLRCLRGNHDEELLAAARGYWRARLFGKDLSRSLQSFGVGHAFDIPDCYLSWLAALPYELELPDFVLVHAGYNFALPPEQMRRDHTAMLNTRSFVYDPARLGGKRLLHGHVPTPTAELRRRAATRPGALGLDTGCAYRHNPELRHLAALNLDTWEVHLAENQEAPYPIGKRC